MTGEGSTIVVHHGAATVARRDWLT